MQNRTPRPSLSRYLCASMPATNARWAATEPMARTTGYFRDHHLVVSSPLPWPQLPCRPLCWLPRADRCDHLRQGSGHRLEPPPARCVSGAPWDPLGYLDLQLLGLCLGRELMDLESAGFGADPSRLTTQTSDHCNSQRRKPKPGLHAGSPIRSPKFSLYYVFLC